MWRFRPGPPRPYRPWGPGFRQQHPASFQRHTFPMQNRPGEFLARLFGRRQPQRVINPFQFGSMNTPIESQSSLPRFLSPENLSRVLGQTQQVLRTVQQVGPMIQQYGPLIRNLPALWKIYKGLSSVETEEETVEDENPEEEKNNDKDIAQDEDAKEIESENENEAGYDHENYEEDILKNRGKIKKTVPEKKEMKVKAGEKYRQRKKKKIETKESVPKLFI